MPSPTFGHYIENTGDADLIYLEMFQAREYQDLPLSDWLAFTPPALVKAHLNLSEETFQKIPKDKAPVAPAWSRFHLGQGDFGFHQGRGTCCKTSVRCSAVGSMGNKER